jgi:hypothetical protein
MHETKRLLRETKKNVLIVAMDVGHTNVSHFAPILPPGNRLFPKRLSTPALTQLHRASLGGTTGRHLPELGVDAPCLLAIRADTVACLNRYHGLLRGCIFKQH